MTKSRREATEKILIAARKKFAESGFEGTNIQDIAKAADVNIAMVSYYFGGKENLYYEIFRIFNISQFLPDFLEKNHHNPIGALKDYLYFLIARVKENPELAIITYQEILEPTERIEMIKFYTEKVFSELVKILQLGKERNVFYFKSINYTIHFIMSIAIFTKFQAFFEFFSKEKEMETLELEETVNYIMKYITVDLSLS